MANVYDLAKIASGDPMSGVIEGAKEASTLFARYEHQKEIIDEINAAIAAAQRKSKKNKFGFGLGGSILGGLLGLATGGIASPVLSTILGAAGAGVGAGAAEKIRQGEWLSELTGREKVTKELSEAQEKFKGRKQAADIGRTEEAIEAELDEMVKADVTSSALSALIFPILKEAAGKMPIFEGATEEIGKAKQIAGKTKLSDLDVQISENLGLDEYTLRGQDPSSNILTDFDINEAFSKEQIMNVQDTIGVSADGVWGPDSQAAYNAQSMAGGGASVTFLEPQGQTAFSQIGTETIPGKYKMGFDPMGMLPSWKEKLPFLSKPWAGMLTRGMAPSVWGKFAYPETTIDPYRRPPFINPYRRR